MKKLPYYIASSVLTFSLGLLAMPGYAVDATKNDAVDHPAITACKDKKVNNNCSFTTKTNHTMNGTCAIRPKHADELICHPEKQHGK